MPRPSRRSFVIAALSLTAGGCSREAPPADAGAADTASPATTAAATPSAAGTGGAAWAGPYRLRGTLEGSRQASGTLALQPLARGAAGYAEAETRVQQTYPSYAGPYYGAELSLVAGADTLRGTFSCAHGPATPPNLVCQPTAPLRGLESATLVMQPGGRAVLTGSHGEGVSVEYGRLNWTTGTT